MIINYLQSLPNWIQVAIAIGITLIVTGAIALIAGKLGRMR